ncbi:MAG: flavodoxin family protein [Saccharofermentanales bacterium]
MKTVMILGSRNPSGQTADAADNMAAGLMNKGILVEKYFLPSMDIRLCRQCDNNGWGICISDGRCVIEDDFEMLVKIIRDADSVVFATPVYFSDLSESMKAFLDRLRRIAMNEKGQSGIKGKTAAGICVAGGGGGGSPECHMTMNRILGTCGFNVLDIITVRRQNTRLKKPVLVATGEGLADHMQNDNK